MTSRNVGADVTDTALPQRAADDLLAALLTAWKSLHDAAGLALGPAEPRPDLCLVVVNNDGGGIFSTLEQAAFPGSFERSSVEARTDRAAGAALRARLRDAPAQAVDRLP